jgi:DNA-binding CsgD family transcriptional regulator
VSAEPAPARPRRPSGYRSWLTWREVARLREMRAAGMGVREISEATGCAPGTVSRHTADLGPWAGRRRYRTVAQERRIVELTRVGMSQRQIAAEVGVGAWTVHDVQRKTGVGPAFRRSADSARFRYAYDEHAWGEALEDAYWRRGLTLAETAAELGVGVDTVRRRMRAIGLRIRTPAESRLGRPHRKRHEFDLPKCARGCGRYVRTPGEAECAACRRRPGLHAADSGAMVGAG